MAWPSNVLEALLKDKSARLFFLRDAKQQYRKGADYMFVTDKFGEPIAGFHIEKFIDSCAKNSCVGNPASANLHIKGN